MFLLLLQDFEVEAYNENKDSLHKLTSDHIKSDLIGINLDYLGNPSHFPKTNENMNYVYVNMVVKTKAAAIKKIVLRCTGTNRELSIDNFTIGLYQDRPVPDTGQSF